ncbi:MAG: hypothetical protein Q4A98_02280 [Comamonadaceae bacterium]|nr:hypothetical protein [Comamonadaceae bacterium]
MADPKKIQRLKRKKKAPRSQGMPAPCRWGKSVMAFAASSAPGQGHRPGAAMARSTLAGSARQQSPKIAKITNQTKNEINTNMPKKGDFLSF